MITYQDLFLFCTFIVALRFLSMAFLVSLIVNVLLSVKILVKK